MRSRRVIWEGYSPFLHVPLGRHTVPRRGPCTALTIFNLDGAIAELFFQGADESHQPLDVFRLQRFSIRGHLILAVGDGVGELSIRHFLYLRSLEIMRAHPLSNRRTGSISSMAASTLRFVESLRALGVRDCGKGENNSQCDCNDIRYTNFIHLQAPFWVFVGQPYHEDAPSENKIALPGRPSAVIPATYACPL